jgi:F-type H+-transporting ATPase subunit delta
MPSRLSRRKIASYIAEQLIDGDGQTAAIRQLAAFLIDNRRTKEVQLIVRDIEFELQNRGVILAEVTTAIALTEATRKEIERLVGQHSDPGRIQLRQFIDPAVIGGVRIDIPGKRLDATIARRLAIFRENYKK